MALANTKEVLEHNVVRVFDVNKRSKFIAKVINYEEYDLVILRNIQDNTQEVVITGDWTEEEGNYVINIIRK